ncbi:MAG: flagellar type III secretion system pore protein FliP [Pirellulaceae bacterium]
MASPSWLVANRCRSRRPLRSHLDRTRDWFFWIAIALGALFCVTTAVAQEPTSFPGTTLAPLTAPAPAADVGRLLGGGPEVWTSREGMTSALQILVLLTVLSVAPAVLLMTTCFVRIVVVLGLLRQAIGLQQSPPSQVITSIALFMTILIMTPVWSDVYHDAIEPYSRPGSDMTLEEAWQEGVRPIRRFMCRQIDIAGNTEDIRLFYQYLPPNTPEPQTYDDVPLQVLLPAFLLSELKTAFVIGFQIFLPFLILDVVIASVTISMGMMMLPPVMISLPFKLLLFVLVDGWRLVVGMLLESFGTISGLT